MMFVKKAAIVFLLSLSISGCSALQSVATDALLGSQSGVDVDANVAKGDAEGANSLSQNANTAVSVGSSESNEYGEVQSVVNDEGFKPYELLLLVLLAGWAIPSPSEMLRGIVKFFTGFRLKPKETN